MGVPRHIPLKLGVVLDALAFGLDRRQTEAGDLYVFLVGFLRIVLIEEVPALDLVYSTWCSLYERPHQALMPGHSALG